NLTRPSPRDLANRFHGLRRKWIQLFAITGFFYDSKLVQIHLQQMIDFLPMFESPKYDGHSLCLSSSYVDPRQTGKRPELFYTSGGFRVHRQNVAGHLAKRLRLNCKI